METFPFELIKRFSFKREPVSLPAELRPMYKIALILLFLRLNCSASTSTILKIQFLNWVLKTEELKEKFIQQTTGKETKYLLKVVHLDPAVNRAVQYAFAEKLISYEKTGKIKLTDLGIKIVDEIILNDDLFVNEKHYLKKLGKTISEVQIKNTLLG